MISRGAVFSVQCSVFSGAQSKAPRQGSFVLTGLSLLLLTFAGGCAQQSVDRGLLPTKLANAHIDSTSPDGKWAVASSRIGETNPQLWYGVIDRKSGRPVFAISERDPRDPDTFEGTVDATAWSSDSHFVACQLRKNHYNDDFIVARLSPGGWKSVLLPHAFVLEEQYSKLPEVQNRYVRQTGGEWIDSIKWTSNRIFRVGFRTTLNVDDAHLLPKSYTFLVDADCIFTSSRPQVRWSGAELSPDQ